MAERGDTETMEKAVRLVIDHRREYSFDWAVITTFAARLGMRPETPRKWVPQSRVDAG